MIIGESHFDLDSNKFYLNPLGLAMISIILLKWDSWEKRKE